MTSSYTYISNNINQDSLPEGLASYLSNPINSKLGVIKQDNSKP